MKWIPRLLLLLLVFRLSPAAGDMFSNRRWEPEFHVLHASRLLLDSLNLPAETQVFSCVLSAEDLQFRRGEAGSGSYEASWEITLEILQGKGRKQRSVASRHERRELLIDGFPKASDLELQLHRFQAAVDPGEYTWWVELQDLNSRRIFRREGRFLVPDLREKDWAISRLWLTSNADSLEPSGLDSPPFVTGHGGAHPEELVVYYEVWCRQARNLALHSLIEDRRENQVHDRRIEREYPAGVSRNLLQVPLDRLASGDYRMLIEVLDPAIESDGHRGFLSKRGPERVPQSAEATFQLRWRGSPGTPSDLDRSIEQLRYILPGKRYRNLADSPMELKKRGFEEFWKSVDPDPETEDNELMREYYRRAEFADQRFSWSRFPGWRSDRGRVYMIHGDPDEVERFEGSMDYPAWERWSYESIGRDFLFIDRAGFGDYQLVMDPGF